MHGLPENYRTPQDSPKSPQDSKNCLEITTGQQELPKNTAGQSNLTEYSLYFVK